MIKDILHKLNYKKRSLMISYSYSRGITRLPYAPAEIFIEPTNYCNLKCIICPQSSGIKREKGYMDFGLFKQAIDKAARSGILKCTLHLSGESLLHKDFISMVTEAKKNGLYVRFHTNATLLSAKLADKLARSELDEISFSFDDPRKEVYEKIRINADFNKTLDNIRYFLGLRKKMGLSKPRVIVQRIKLSNFIYGPDNEEEYKKIFRGLGVDKFNTILTHNWAGTCQGGSIESYSAKENKVPCLAIWSRFAIGWDGKAYACCNDMDGKLLIGDLNNSNIMDIWNGAAMVALRSAMAAADYDKIGLCRDCDVLLRATKPKMGISRRLLAKAFLGFKF